MSKMPAFPVEDPESLLKLSNAHQAFHLVNQQYREDLDAAIKAVDLKHSPFIYAAQSVLYESMRNASLNGFDTEQMQVVMGCGAH